MVMLVVFPRRDFLAAGPVVAQILLRIVLRRSPASAENLPVACGLIPFCQVLDYRAAAGVFREPIGRRVGNADQAVILVADEFAHLQIRFRRIGHADIIGAIQRNDFPIARAGNAAAQINLAAVGIDIGNDQFLRRRVVVDIGLVLVGAVRLQDFATRLYEIVRPCRDDRIGQILFSHTRPAAIQLLDFRRDCIGNGDFVFAIAALDQAIDIDVRRIDVDVITGNARTAAVEHIIMRPVFPMDTGGVFIAIGFVEFIYFAVEILVFVQLFRVAADVDDPLGKALADALAGRQVDFLAVDFRRAVAFALQEDAVVLVLYIDDTIFRLHIAVDFDIGLRDEFGIDFLARLLALCIDFINLCLDGSRAVVTLDGDCSTGTGGSIGADRQVDGSGFILIGTLDDGSSVLGQGLAVVMDFTARIDCLHIPHFQIKIRMVFHGDFRTSLCLQRTGALQAACFHHDIAARSDDIRQDDGIHRKPTDRHQILLAVWPDCLRKKAEVVEFVIDARLLILVAFQSRQVLAVTVLTDQCSQFIVACHQGIGVINARISDLCRIDTARSVNRWPLDSLFLSFDGFDGGQFIVVQDNNLSRPADDNVLLILCAGRHLTVNLYIVIRLIVDAVGLLTHRRTREIFLGIAVIPGVLHRLLPQVFIGFICIRMDMAYTGDFGALADDDLVGLCQGILEFRNGYRKRRLVVGFRFDSKVQVIHDAIRVFARIEIDIIQAVDFALDIDFVGPLQSVLHIRRSTASGPALGIGYAFGRHSPVVRSRQGDIAVRRIRAQGCLSIGTDGILAGQVIVHIHPGSCAGTGCFDVAGRIDLAARFSCQNLAATARKGRIAGIHSGRAVHRIIELGALHRDTAIPAAFNSIRLVLTEVCLAVRLSRERAAAGDLTARQYDISSTAGRIIGLGGTGTDDGCLRGIGVQVHMVRLVRLDSHVTFHIPAAFQGNLTARIRLVVHCTGQITADHATTAAIGRRQIMRRAAGIDGQRFELCLVAIQCDGRHIGIVFRAASRIGQIRAAGEKSANGDAAGIGCGLRRIGRYHVQSRSPVFLEGSLAQCHLCIDVRIGCCRIDDGRTAAGRCKALDLGFTVVFSILAFGAGCDFCLVNIESRAVSYLDAGFAFGRGRCHRRTGTAEKGNRETARFRRDSRTGRGLQACSLTTEDAVFLAVALRDENLGCTLVTCQGNDAVGTDQAEGATVRSCRHNIGLIGLQVSRSLGRMQRTSLDCKIHITGIVCLGNKGSGRHETCRRAVNRRRRLGYICCFHGDILAAGSQRGIHSFDFRLTAGATLGIGCADSSHTGDIRLIRIDARLATLRSCHRKGLARLQFTATDADAGIFLRIEDSNRRTEPQRTRNAGRSRRNLGIGLAIRAEVQRICCGDGSVRHRHLGALGIALAGRSGDAGSIDALDARIRIVEGVPDHLAAGCSAIGGGRLLGIQGRIGLLQHSGGIKGSSVVIAAAVGIRQFGADGGHHHVGIDAQAAHRSAHQVLIHVQFFPGGNSRFPGRDGALVHLGQGGGANGVDTHPRGNGGTARTESGCIELGGHLIVGVHGEVLIGRDFAVVHHCRSLAVHIVDGNRRSSSPHGTGHAGHHCGHIGAAVRRHFHGTGITQAAVFLCRNRAAHQFCIRGEVIIDHANAGSHSAGDHGRRHRCRSADQSGLVVVFGRDFQSLVGAGDVLHGGGNGAIEFGGRSRCRHGACTVDPSGSGHAVRVGDHRGLLARRYSHVPAVDGLLRRIRAAQFRSRLPAQEQGIRSRADPGPAIGADAHRQGPHMAFAGGHILSLYGHVVGRAVIEIFIDVRISHRRPGGAANVVDGHRAGCAHGHIVGAGQTGRQGHALQIMLTGSFYSHAFLLVADRFGLLALCFQGAAFHGAFRIARDGIVADAHAETGIAGRAAHGPGKVRQVFFAVCQYTDVAAARNGAARHNGLHIVANLVHGNVAGQGCLTGHGRAKTDGRNGRVACCLHGGMLVFDRTAAHGSRGILVNPVHADTGTAGKITAAGADNGQGVNLALAVRFNRHRGPFVRILVNHAVLYFRRHGLIDKSRGRCALDGHLAGTAHAQSCRGQLRAIDGLDGRGPAGHMSQGGLRHGCAGLLAGFFSAGGRAAHIVVGYGAAQGHLAAGTDIPGSSHPHIVAFRFHFHGFGVCDCSFFYGVVPVFRAHFTYSGFRVTATVVHHYGPVHGCCLAGGHSSPQAVDLPCILAFHIHAHASRRGLRRYPASGQVGTDMVVQPIVSQGGPHTCRLAVGHGTGHIHGLGIAGCMHLQVIRGQGGIRHLGLDPVVLILPGHAAHAAEVLGAGGHTGGHVHRQAVRFGLGGDLTRRQGRSIDFGRKGIVQVGHVHGRAGRIVLGTGHYKGGAHTEAALVAVEVHFFTGRIQAVAAVGGLVIGSTFRIHPCILEQAFLLPIGAQFVLIGLGLIRTAGGIVGFHGNGIRREIGAICNVRTHRIVQPVVEHGTGEGIVRAVAAYGYAGRDGRRNLFGGQKALHLGLPNIGIGTAVDPGFQVVVDVGHSQAAAGCVAAADGHVRIDAAGDLHVTFVGRHVDVCFFRVRFSGHPVVFRQSLDVLVDQVHRSRSPAGEVVAGLAALGEGQSRPGRYGGTAAQGFDVQALHPGQFAVAHGCLDGIVNGVHAHGTAEGHTGVVLAALTLAQGNSRTAAVGPHIGRVTGAHAHGPVVIQVHRGSVHHRLGGILHQVQGKAPGPGQAEGRRRVRLGGHCGLGTALALAAGVHPGNGILHFIGNGPYRRSNGPHRVRHLAEQVAHAAHAALFRLAFFRFRAAGGHASGHAHSVHQAGGLCIHLEGGGFDPAFVIVIIGGGDVFHRSPVGHVDVVHRHGDPGCRCPIGSRQRQDGIVHVGVVVSGNGNAALVIVGLLFHGLQQGVLIHQHLVGTVAVGQSHHAADGRAVSLAGRQHDPGMEHVGFAGKSHIPGSQAGPLVHLDQSSVVEILVVETAADPHPVRFTGGRIVQPEFALAGHGHIFDGFIRLQVQGISSSQLGILPHLHLAVEVEIRNGDGSRRSHCRVCAALGRSRRRDVGIVVGAQVFHGGTDHIHGAGQQVRHLVPQLLLGFEKRILGLDIRIKVHGRVLQFQELVVQIPAGGRQVRHFVESSLRGKVRPVGAMFQIVLVEGNAHVFQFPFQGHQIVIDGFQVTEFTEIFQFLPVLHVFGCRLHSLEAVIQPLLDFRYPVVIHPGAGLEGKVLPSLQLGLLILRPVFHRHAGRILHASEHGSHSNGHRIGITVRVLEGAGDTGSGQQGIIHRIVGGSRQGAFGGFCHRILAEIHLGRSRFVGHGNGGPGGQGVPQGIRQGFGTGGAAGSSRIRALGSLAHGILHQGIFLDLGYDALHIGGLHDPLHELGLELALPQVVVGAVGIFRRMVGGRKGHILVRLHRSLYVDGGVPIVDNHIHGGRTHGGIRCLGGCRRVQALGGVRVHFHAARFGFCRTVHFDLGIVVAVGHRHSGHNFSGASPQQAGTDHRIGTVGHGRSGVGLHLQGFLLAALTVRSILAGGLHLAIDLDSGFVVRLGIAHPGSRNLAGNLFEIFLAGSHRTGGAVQVSLSLRLHRIPGDRGILSHSDAGFVFQQHHIGAHRHRVAEGIPQFIRKGIAAVHIGVVGAGLHVHGALSSHIPLHIHFGHSLGKAAGIAGIGFLPFLEIAVGGFGSQGGIPGSFHRAMVLHAGGDGLGDIDVRAAQKPGGVH